MAITYNFQRPFDFLRRAETRQTANLATYTHILCISSWNPDLVVRKPWKSSQNTPNRFALELKTKPDRLEHVVYTHAYGPVEPRKDTYTDTQTHTQICYKRPEIGYFYPNGLHFQLWPHYKLYKFATFNGRLIFLAELDHGKPHAQVRFLRTSYFSDNYTLFVMFVKFAFEWIVYNYIIHYSFEVRFPNYRWALKNKFCTQIAQFALWHILGMVKVGNSRLSK